jgi:aerobic carbon-monoxide dehydrogenase medium subunit
VLADAEVFAAPDLPAALAELAGPLPTTVCAGGTDLVPRLRNGDITSTRILLCRRLAELGHITGGAGSAGGVRIGAAVTYRAIAGSALLAETVPVLRDLSAHLANPRVRNRGTIGGHVCAARPRYDVLTLLTALDARAHVASVRGTRVVPVADFVLAERRTVLAPDELLVEIQIPVLPPPHEVGFERVGTSQGPMVNVAAWVRPELTTVVIGAVGARPIRLEAAGPHDPAALLDRVRTAAFSDEPGLAGPWYRAQVATTLAGRLLGRLRTGGGRADG